MLFDPNPSPLDLRWRMFGIPIRIHWSFWLFALLFGWHFMQRWGIGALLVWIACLLVSVLIHELGHAIVARLFGAPSVIAIYFMGGAAMGDYEPLRRWQRIAIYAAGPAAGFALLGGVWLFRTEFNFAHLGNAEVMVRRAVWMLTFMNFAWNMLNLLPVYPLDGGQIVRELCLGVSASVGLQLSLILSLLCAGGIAVYAYLAMTQPDQFQWIREQGSELFLMIFFIYFAVHNLIQLIQVQRERRSAPTEEQTW